MTAGSADVVIVGGGHNALVAAIELARAGLAVEVLEAKDVLGGACRTEHPFPRAPSLGQSTGAYLLGLFPPELLHHLGLELPLLRRDPHYFLPTTGNRYLLFGRDREASRAQMTAFFSDEDARADEALAEELRHLREDLAPTFIAPPLGVEDTADRYVRPSLRRRFISLCRGSVGSYLDGFGFRSELLRAMYAVTDGFTGSHGGYRTPGTGMNFLIHNMCRLPDSDGTWMVVEGGMGTITQELTRLARTAGAKLRVGAEAAEIEVHHRSASSVVLTSGERIDTAVVVLGCDPFTGLRLLGDAAPRSYRRLLRDLETEGTTLKVNLALNGLPTFACLPEDRGQHRATIHLLPQERILDSLDVAYRDASEGRLPEMPSIEWYIHTPVDPTLGDEQGRQSSALFVQWVPYAIEGKRWEDEIDRYVAHLLRVCDRFAPGTSDRVEDVFALHPQAIESHFGMHRGHIHHVDNRFGFAERLPYRVPVEGVYNCGAGCHPGGSVIGAAGYNAARAVMADLGLPEADSPL